MPALAGRSASGRLVEMGIGGLTAVAHPPTTLRCLTHVMGHPSGPWGTP